MAIFYYDPTGANGTGDGSSAANASGSSTAALNALSNNNTLYLTAGSFTVTSAQADGKTITGAGDILVTGLQARPNGDFSGIVAGAQSGTLTSSVTFTGNLGNLGITISSGAVLTAADSVLWKGGLSTDNAKFYGAGDLKISNASASAANIANIAPRIYDTGFLDASLVTTITGVIADATSVYAATNINGLGNETVNLSDTTLAASDLNTLDGKTSSAINASSATLLTGAALDVATAISSSGINIPAGVGVTLNSPTAWATPLNIIDANTTAVVNASAITMILGSAANVATAISSSGINTATGVTASLSGGTAAATDLNTIDSNTTTAVDATAVSTITGLVPDVKTAIASAGITTATNYAASLTDSSVSVNDANTVDVDTSGVVTATITSGTVSTLNGLSGTGNAYTLTVTDTTASASGLSTLDGKTTVNVNANGVMTLTGTATEILITHKPPQP